LLKLNKKTKKSEMSTRSRKDIEATTTRDTRSKSSNPLIKKKNEPTAVVKPRAASRPKSQTRAKLEKSLAVSQAQTKKVTKGTKKKHEVQIEYIDSVLVCYQGFDGDVDDIAVDFLTKNRTVFVPIEKILDFEY
jgi:hypothetical protein